MSDPYFAPLAGSYRLIVKDVALDAAPLMPMAMPVIVVVLRMGIRHRCKLPVDRVAALVAMPAAMFHPTNWYVSGPI